VIGKTGKVIAVDSDGDIKVKFDAGGTWIFNAQCCELVSQGGQAARVSSARPSSSAVNTQSKSSSDDDDDDNDNSQCNNASASVVPAGPSRAEGRGVWEG